MSERLELLLVLAYLHVLATSTKSSMRRVQESPVLPVPVCRTVLVLQYRTATSTVPGTKAVSAYY